MTKGYIGSRIQSRETRRLLVGRGLYVDDLKLSGMVCAHFLRSPHAHARIQAMDCDQARRVPGVIGVWTYSEIGPRVKGIRPVLESSSYKPCEWPPLAAGKVRFVGEAVAVVVATDRYRAEDAAEAIRVEYVPLKPVPDVATSLENQGPRVHEEFEDNILFEYKLETGEVNRAFQEADLRISRSFQHPRCTGLAIENRGLVAQYDPYRQILTVWSSTQVPDLLRKTIAECLQLPAHKVRVIAPDVGGGFGVKMHVFPEDLVVCFLARELRRPVKWIEDRRENLMASMHARDHTLHAEIAARKDGQVLALRVQDLCDVGAYSAYPITCALEPLTCASVLPGPYRIQNFSFDGKAIATNKCPVGAYRGVGFVLSTLVIETLMDELARAAELDPAEVRCRNFIGSQDFPYQASGGVVYDSGNYAKTLERALEAAGYKDWRKRQAELRQQGRTIGIGLASFVEPTGMGRRVFRRRGMREVPGFDSATVKVDPSGTVRAYLSTPSQGQGQETSFAQLLADEMGLRLEDIHVFLGDTETSPSGNGTFASRSIVSAGSALVLAGRTMRSKLLAAAAPLLQAPSGELDIQEGSVVRRDGTGRALSLRELALAIHSPIQEFPAEVNLDLETTSSFSVEGAAIACGTHIAIVEVDPETGTVAFLRYIAVEDCGKVINPAIVDGQIRGGVVQGLGTALYESLRYDSQGQLLTASLMDYLAPGATEAPAIEIEHFETPSPLTPTGSKGVGESGTIAAPAAISSAISDALAPFGVTFAMLPITPQDIVEALSRAKEKAIVSV